MAAALEGLRVLVTRPAHQAEGLCARIAALGGCPIRFPILEILPPRDAGALEAALARLPECALAIFTSANAVDGAAECIAARGGLPPGTAVAAIGRASARALARHGITATLVPATGDRSEDLLALPALALLAGTRVLLVRGEGGRELLAATLAARGAEVIHAIAYRRARSAADPAPLLERLARGAVDVVVATSNDTLAKLFDLVGEAGRQCLLDTPLLVVSPRGAALARSLGFRHPPLLSAEAGDEAVVAALTAWKANRTQPLGIR